MGRALYESSPAARACFDEACDIVQSDLRALCFSGPEEQLNRTDVSQPAILACSVASCRAAVEQGKIDPAALAVTAGLSLGEYTALHLAGAMSFADALRLVALRGRCMQQAAEQASSGMLALIGADEFGADSLCREAAEGEILLPANYNAPGQIVISGASGAIERAARLAEQKGIKAVVLKVAGAFHSPYMQPAADAMAAALATANIVAPKVRVFSNVTGAPHESADTVRQLLVQQITAPVRWAQTLAQLLAEPLQLVELAPGRTLAGMAKRINRRVAITSLQEQA